VALAAHGGLGAWAQVTGGKLTVRGPWPGADFHTKATNKSTATANASSNATRNVLTRVTLRAA
jgi:hypothetical protein